MTEENRIQDAAVIQRILEERARALSRADQTESIIELVELLVFALGGERYAVDLKYVQEVRPLNSITRVPGAPPFYAGLVNMRGRLYPALDLPHYLSLPETRAAENSHVVLVSAAGLEVCLRVDNVLGVQQAAAPEIAPLVAEPLNRRESTIGVTPDLISILDLEAILSDPKLVIQDQFI
jgi:purine-binding chemotaxis protein CheW